MSLRRLGVKIQTEYDSTGADRAEKSFKKVGDSAEKGSKGIEKASKATKFLDDNLKKLVAGGTIVLIGKQLLAFASASIEVASSAQETASLIDNSLGPAAQGFRQDIEELASATNRSRVELEAGASTIIAMTRSMGMGQEAAGDYSATMAQIATDLGSFFNQSTEQVFLDLQGALGGSSETMQKYGIDVRETQLKNIALEQGLISQGETLDRVTRAQVIQSEVLRQAADAMGDAERTAGSYENTQRGLQAAVLDLQMVIGEALIPVMTELSQEVIPAIKQATEDAKPALEDFGRLLSDSFGNVVAAAQADKLQKELIGLGVNFNKMGLSIQKIPFKDAVAGLTDMDKNTANLNKQSLVYQLTLDGIARGLEVNSQELGDYVRVQFTAIQRAEAMNEAFGGLVKTEEDLAEVTEEVTRITSEQAESISKAYRENQTYEVSAKQVEEAERARAEAHEEATAATEAAAEAMYELEQRTAGYFSSSLPAIEQTDTLEYQLYKAAEAAGASASELALLGIQLGLFTQEQAEAALKAAALQVEIDRLGTLIAGGMGIDEALEMLDQFQERLDRRYTVDVDVSAALARLSELQNSADVLAQKLGGAGGPDVPTPSNSGGGGGTGNSPGSGGPPPGGNVGPPAQHGLRDYIVPPGFPRDDFYIPVSSGERVNVSRRGESDNNGGGFTIQGDIVIHTRAENGAQLADELIRELGKRTRSRVSSAAYGSRF